MARLGEYGYYGPYGSGGTTSRSQALASAFGAVNIIYRVEDTTIFRDALGRFEKAQKEIERRNRQLASTLRESVVRETYKNPRRPTVSTGRLRKAWNDPKHFQPAPGGARFGFGLFDPNLLDQSEAKYWRLIEYGTKDVLGGRWTGRMVDAEGVPLFGRWGGSIKGYYNNRWGRVPSAGPPFSGPVPGMGYFRISKGQVQGGKLGVFPKAVRESMINPRTGKTPKAAYRRRHIAPKNAIDTSWNKYGSEEYATKLLASIRRELGIP